MKNYYFIKRGEFSNTYGLYYTDSSAQAKIYDNDEEYERITRTEFYELIKIAKDELKIFSSTQRPLYAIPLAIDSLYAKYLLEVRCGFAKVINNILCIF